MTAPRPQHLPPMNRVADTAPAWAPGVRRQLERLKHLEHRERRSRRARWDVPLADDNEPEGWLLSYLDLVTLMLVMLVVLLALARQSSVALEAAAPPASAAIATAPSLPDAASIAPPGAAPLVATAAENAPSPVPPAPAIRLPLTLFNLAPPASVEDIAFAIARAAADENAPPTLGVAPIPAPATAATPVPFEVALTGSLAQTRAGRPTLAWTFADPDFVLPPLPDTPIRASANAAATPAIDAGATLPVTTQADTTAGQAKVAPPATPPSLEALGLTELGDDVDVIVNEQSVSLRISNEILFASGHAILTAPGYAVLDRVAQALGRNDYRISVEGHTDPIPIQTEKYPSNWELSTARATSVLRQLEARGIAPERLRATGHAHTRPLATNDDADGRAINRRVEIILETH